MIRRLAYGVIFTLGASCAIVSLFTGEGGIHEFDVEAPDDPLDYATFVPLLIVDTVQFIVSCISWDFVPDLPTKLRVLLVAFSALPVAVIFIMDILPPLANAVGSILDAFIPG